MLASERLNTAALDIPTLFFVAVCVTALLGLVLISAWLKERDVRALAWWGAAYLIGAAAMVLWTAPQALIHIPPEINGGLIFVACGMIWNGVRLFRGRRVLPLAAFSGAIAWVILSHIPVVGGTPGGRSMLGAVIVAVYTFFIAFELWRERRKARQSSPAAIIVPLLHAAVFLIPIGMHLFLPEEFAVVWQQLFVLETVLYAVGTAFIVLLMVKDHHVHIHRTAASTDHLTGLLNRRAFLEAARRLSAYSCKRGQPVTFMMFDLDHFKSINDRFGHAIGDEALKVFSASVRLSMRADDVIGRLGGEEFAAIVPAGSDIASKIAERVRANFEGAGAIIGGHVIGGTVSIGAACGVITENELEMLMARADNALYKAKHAGRNRVHRAEELPVDPTRAMIAARSTAASRAWRSPLALIASRFAAR